MRQIKFKAWREKYNSLGGKMYSHEELLEINDWDNLFRGKSILGKLIQFTGLTDKNGKEIYEGDLIRWEKGISGTWSDQSGKTQEVKYPFICGNADLGEVIGNIYENKNPL